MDINILSKILNNSDNLYAHIKEKTNNAETILEHAENTIAIYDKINNIYDIKNKFLNSYRKLEISKNGKVNKLNQYSLDFIYEMFISVLYFHDTGKINPKFQIEKMQNSKINEYRTEIQTESKGMNSNHSDLSMIIYLNHFYTLIMDNSNINEKPFILYLLLSFGNIISGHHTLLKDLAIKNDDMGLNNELTINLEKKISEIETFPYLFLYNEPLVINKNLKSIITKINKVNYDTFTVFIWNRILYSLLITTDFISTYCFFNNISTDVFEFNQIKDIEKLKEVYRNTDIYKGIESYIIDKNYFKKNNLPIINALRSDILLECRSTLRKNLSEKIFNIESPTGSGKTFNSLTCALELLKPNTNMFYVFPLNTISNQTKNVLSNIFKDNLNIQEINSITPIPIKEDDYKKALLDKQIWNYEAVITSNISLFNTLFSTNREATMSLFRLFNSVVILDEIQNYKNSIWKETIEFLYKFADIMNIKIIIMSATLPNLEELISFKSNKFINLMPNAKKYYNNPLFKNRVEVDTSLLTKKLKEDNLIEIVNLIQNSVEERNKKESLKQKVEVHSKFILEFIKKKVAQDFYNNYKNKFGDNFEIYELDGDDNNFNKDKIIEKLKTENPKKNILLITTQIVEAGVDIDMDLGAKDCVFPDVDEQFLGRINRSCNKKNCTAYFFNCSNEDVIYKNDFRLGTNIKKDEFLKCLIDKNFETLYKEVFSKIEASKNTTFASCMNRLHNDYLKYQKYSEVERLMKLIDLNTFSIFLPTVINGVDGGVIWNEYCSILNDETLSYAKKRVKLINIRTYLSSFVINIYGKSISGLEPVGGFYYIEDTEKFIINGKFNRKIFKNHYCIEK